MKRRFGTNNLVNVKSILMTVTMVAFLFMFLHAMDDQPKTQPLVPMMQGLLENVHTIDNGLFTENFEWIEKGSRAIANHPVMTESDKERVKNTLADRFSMFVEFDQIVHHHADSVAQAASLKQMEQVLKHYRIVRQGCINCHIHFRKPISDARKQ